MLQIGQYGIAEFLLLVSTLGFAWQIKDATKNRLFRFVLTALCLVMNIYFATVVYKSKGDRSWLGVISPPPMFQVTVESVLTSGPLRNTSLFVKYPSALGPVTVSPVNVYLSARILNTSPYPIRLTRYKGDMRDEAKWFKTRTRLLPIPLSGMSLYWRNSGSAEYTSMQRLDSSFVPLDLYDAGQIESARSRNVVAAFEYPGDTDRPAFASFELTVYSDVAGYSSGISRPTGEVADRTVQDIGGIGLRPSAPVNFGPSIFVYYSDLQNEIAKRDK